MRTNFGKEFWKVTLDIQYDSELQRARRGLTIEGKTLALSKVVYHAMSKVFSNYLRFRLTLFGKTSIKN